MQSANNSHPTASGALTHLEHPFYWREQNFSVIRQPELFPAGRQVTISFQPNLRKGKILGYLPIIGTIIGIWRIFRAKQEYQYFAQHAQLDRNLRHMLKTQSVQWMTRGIIECLPLLGGLICAIIDLATTLLTKNAPEERTTLYPLEFFFELYNNNNRNY